MTIARHALFVATALGLAACASGPPPSSFSRAVQTDSGLSSTGGSPAGGAAAGPRAAGAIATTPVR